MQDTALVDVLPSDVQLAASSAPSVGTVGGATECQQAAKRRTYHREHAGHTTPGPISDAKPSILLK